MMYLLLGLVLLPSIFVQSSAQEFFGYCTTPGLQSGSCIPLQSCNYLYELVTRSPVSASDRQFLASSQCGYRNNQVLICCANTRRLPDQPVWGGGGGGGGGRPQPATPAPTPAPVKPQTVTTRSSLLPKVPDCGGNFGDRIYGGVATGKKEFPWLTLIEYTKPGNLKGHHCGGSLINNRYVLTAAHCLLAIPETWRLTGVRLGEYDTATNPDCTAQRNGQTVCNDPYLDLAVIEAVAHPQYSASSKDQFHDIALLRMERTVTYSDYISPVCLPILPEQRNTIFLGRKMVVSGWGRTETNATSNIKLKAEVDPVPTSDCNQRYATQRRTITTNQICAGGVEGIDSCRGDSGGPLVMEEFSEGFGNFYLTGVVSYGPTPCGLAGWPGVYTLVSSYIEWIENTMKP